MLLYLFKIASFADRKDQSVVSFACFILAVLDYILFSFFCSYVAGILTW